MEDFKKDDGSATVADLKNIVRSFCEDRDWDQFHSPLNLAVGITTESAELLDLFRFKSDAEIQKMFDDPDRREMICDEVADVLYFILRFAQMNGIDLSKELARKVSKNGLKYPVEKSRGSNRKYTEL